jgi:hypothetical protein
MSVPKWLVKIGHFFKSSLGWIIKSDPFKQLIAELMPIAIDAVSSLNSLDKLSSSQKRAQVFVIVSGAAKQKGLEFGDHMINLLIELAVAKIKGTLGE